MAKDRPLGTKANQGSIPNRSYAQIIKGLKPNPRLLSSSVETLVPTTPTILPEPTVYKGEPSFLLSKEEDDRPLVARACMEVDLLKDLPKRIRLGVEGNTYFQAVTYENLPEYCTECSKIGHSVKNSTEKLQIIPKEAQKQTKYVWKAKPSVLQENEMEKTKDHHGPSTSGLSNEEKQSIPVDVMERSPLIQIQLSGKRKLTKERLVSIIQENDKEPSLLDSWDIAELKNLQVDEQNVEKQRGVSPQRAVSPEHAVFVQTIETSSRFEVLADLDNPVTRDTEVDANLQEDIDSDVGSDKGTITEKPHEHLRSTSHDQILVSVHDSEIGGSLDFVSTEEARGSASDGEERKKKRGRPKGSKNGVNNNGNEGETRRSARLQGDIPPNV
ncbi:OLC1v1018906C1 [Oldenlandia corymbosa var. corymbosa]|uniref:OLC1v1018906C1 n=1 Tax=Oldenlandia corymbosa var. corymbosa TaxID=529605 RepID=A0AAV1ECU5_OLDCO|nr:OLC1v1018906C1 [Oldenlandia corymbosa var. corymbosa]